MTSLRLVTAAGSPDPEDRAAVLRTARDRLLRELDTRHHPSCGCECGPAPDARVLATVSRELRAVLSELAAMPAPDEGSVSASLADRVAAKRT